MSTASLANDRFAAVHWAGQAAHQFTMDFARRAHQSPGRLVDEDGLRGLPLAQQTGQGRSGVVAFLVWELVRLQETLHRRRRENGLHLARQVRHWSLRHALCRQDCESRWRHINRSVHLDSTYVCLHTYRIYIRRVGSRAAVCTASIHPSS